MNLANIILVLRVNAFSKRLEDGYLMDRNTRRTVDKLMTPTEAASWLAANPAVTLSVLHV